LHIAHVEQIMTDMSDNKSWRIWLAAAVLLHAVVATWHGAAHMQVPVPLTTLQTAFVGIVITLAPLVGMAMLWTSRRREGAVVIAVSMFASLIFGVVNHFVLHSPDNVLELPEHAWRHSFVLSAVLVAVTETAGAVLGAVAAKAWWRDA
jgi:hypothetical protein